MIRNFFLVLLTLFLSSTSAFAEGEAVVTAYGGDAHIVRMDEKQPAVKGMLCAVNDKIEVGETGYVDIGINGMAGCRFLANTQGKLKSLMKNNTVVHVSSGDILLNIDKLPEGGTFQLETPVATAAVRGTKFWGRVDPGTAGGSQKFALAVWQGIVDVQFKDSEQKFEVHAGKAIEWSQDTEPALRNATHDELNAIHSTEDIRYAPDPSAS